MVVTPKLISALNSKGIGIRPINQDEYSINNEPKWELYKLNN